MQKIFFCKVRNELKLPDLNFREKIVSVSLIVAIVFLGLFPQPVFDIAEPALNISIKQETEQISTQLSKSVNKDYLNVVNLKNYEISTVTSKILIKNTEK